MRRCADQVDCGYENRDSDSFCRACALPLLYTALIGRYVVEALLSKGGYAAVFRGVDQNLSRHVAIKVLLPSKTTPVNATIFCARRVLLRHSIIPILPPSSITAKTALVSSSSCPSIPQVHC